jgi:hypothetical protein
MQLAGEHSAAESAPGSAQSEMTDQETEEVARALTCTPASFLLFVLIIRVSGQVSTKKVLRFFEKVRREAYFHAHFLPQCMYHVHSNMPHEGPHHADRPLSPPVAVYKHA